MLLCPCRIGHSPQHLLYWLRVALTEWFVWNAAVTLDFSKYLASTLGLENPVRVSFLNMAFDVSVSSSTLGSVS